MKTITILCLLLCQFVIANASPLQQIDVYNNTNCSIEFIHNFSNLPAQTLEPNGSIELTNPGKTHTISVSAIVLDKGSNICQTAAKQGASLTKFLSSSRPVYVSLTHWNLSYDIMYELHIKHE